MTLLQNLRAWLGEIAEEQFQRHRRWLRGLKREQEHTIRAQLLPSVTAQLALACAQEGLLCELLGEGHPPSIHSGQSAQSQDQLEIGAGAHEHIESSGGGASWFPA